MQTEELLAELFRRGQLIRDSWWAAYKANLERISVELRASEAFVGDYGHLVAQLPEPPPAPQTIEPAPQQHLSDDEWSRNEHMRRLDEALGRGQYAAGGGHDHQG